MFESLVEQPPDPLLALIAQFRDDPRPDKLDLGVGVHRDPHGATPVFRAIKAAERSLFENQDTKAHLGPEGDPGFIERLRPIVLDEATRSPAWRRCDRHHRVPAQEP